MIQHHATKEKKSSKKYIRLKFTTKDLRLFQEIIQLYLILLIQKQGDALNLSYFRVIRIKFIQIGRRRKFSLKIDQQQNLEQQVIRLQAIIRKESTLHSQQYTTRQCKFSNNSSRKNYILTLPLLTIDTLNHHDCYITTYLKISLNKCILSIDHKTIA